MLRYQNSSDTDTKYLTDTNTTDNKYNPWKTIIFSNFTEIMNKNTKYK